LTEYGELLKNVPTEPSIAFATRTHEPPGLEIRINFGMYAGREATAAEIDELGKELLARVNEVSIISEARHEMADNSEAALHQVRIEVPVDDLPAEGRELDELRGRLIEVSERWAQTCIAERHVDVE
jgi:hypothetical protein